MSDTPVPGTRTAAIALIVTGLAVAAARWLEIGTREGTDADDAASSLRYLAESGDVYVAVGLLLIVAAGALVIGALATRALLSDARAGLWLDAVTLAAVLGAGALALAGVIHASAPGPLGYISSLDPDWGEAGYTAVQVIGNQGIYAAGLLGLAFWQLGIAVIAFRRRTLPRGLILFALPAAVYALSLTAAFYDAPEAFFFVNVFSLTVGIPLWCVVIGVALLVRMRRRPVSPASS
jgi:hypothetical protein